MTEIALNYIEKYYGGNKILDRISFDINGGERVGILGRNGTGKTTIFKIIAGMENYDGGNISIRKGAVIGYLDQIPDFPKQYKVIDVLNEAFKEIFSLREQMRNIEVQMGSVENVELDILMKRYASIQIELESKGGYEIEEKLSKVCSGLKINSEFQNRDFNSLSGGEKTTVILARTLLQNPDILLLDEPSNHLDIDSVEWLEVFLKEYKGTVLVISHDRYLLDTIVNRIIEIVQGKAEEYSGNYSYYVKEKERRISEAYETYKVQQRKIKSMEDAVKRFREWGNRGDNDKMFKKAANMEKRIEKMEKIGKPLLDKKTMGLEFLAEYRSGKDAIIVKDLSKSYEVNNIFNRVNLYIKYGEKVAILGKNGSGKTTLFKILLGKETADMGESKFGSNVKIGYLEQNISFSDIESTILEAFRDYYPVSEGEARSILARFLFYSEDVFKKVGSLSGGEKVRLKLCILMHQDINLLLLDEPTNHLDIDSKEILEEALLSFEGTIVFISHDRYFINKIADRICEIKEQRIISYVGDYNYYIEEKQKDDQANNIKKPSRNKENRVNHDFQQKRKEKDIYELEKEIEIIEEEIALMEEEIFEYVSNFEVLSKLYDEKNELQKKRDCLLEKWIEYTT